MDHDQEDIVARIARRSRRRRELQGLTQEQLAQRAGIRPSTLSRLENGRGARVSVAVVKAIADALTCSIGELVDPETPALTERERQLVCAWRSLEGDEQEAVSLLLARLAPQVIE